MRHEYTTEVREYDVGADGALHHANLARFFQAAAFSATRALGLGDAWYEARGTAWVVRSLRLECVSPARLQDRLTIQTWLSSLRRVRGTREYLASADGDQRIVARAQTEWVHIDRGTGAPARLPQEAIDHAPLDAEMVCQLSLAGGAPAGDPAEHERAVEWRELDGLQHVNNAVYLEWFEQAWCDASGLPPASIRAVTIAFDRAARLGDRIAIHTQRAANGVWAQTAALRASGEPVARCLVLPG